MKQKTVKNTNKNALAKPQAKKLNKKVIEEPIVESDEEELQEEDIESETENIDEVEENEDDGSSDEDEDAEDAGDGSIDDDDDDEEVDEEEKLEKTNGATNGKNLAKDIEKKKALAAKTIIVTCLRKDLSKNQISEKFNQFGEIKNIFLLRSPIRNSARILFADAEAANAAKKLHGTIYYGVTIRVFLQNDIRANTITENPERTITLFNKQHLTSLTDKQVESLLAAFEPIEKIDVLCQKSILGFVTLKNVKQVKKALLLNGTTVAGVELHIELYKPVEKAKNRSIVVENLRLGESEEDIRAHFNDCGNISALKIFKKNIHFLNAHITFDSDDAYCKSFLLHESKINGKTIFISPFSTIKSKVLGFKKHGKPNNKRAAPKSGGESPKKRFKFDPKKKIKKSA